MTVQDLTVAHPSLVAPLHVRGPWTTVGTCSAARVGHCPSSPQALRPLIIVGGFRSRPHCCPHCRPNGYHVRSCPPSEVTMALVLHVLKNLQNRRYVCAIYVIWHYLQPPV